MRLDLGTLAILKMPWMKHAHFFQHNGTATTFEQYSHSKGDEERDRLEKALEEGVQGNLSRVRCCFRSSAGTACTTGYRE
jgi:hypothetical protein